MQTSILLPLPQRDVAYAELRRLLLLQQVPAGEHLREPYWAQRLGVHRTALREAFVQLEAEGLVQRGMQTGYFVPRLTRTDLLEIAGLRLALEVVAIEWVCVAVADGDAGAVDRLRGVGETCEEAERFLQADDWLEFVEADRRFHERLIDAAGSKRLSKLYHRAPLPIVHGGATVPDEWRRTCKRVLREHRSVLGALRRGDAEQATRVLREHIGGHALASLGQ